MKAQVNALTLKAKVPRRSRGWLAAIVAAVLTAGVASALLLTRSGGTSVPAPIQAPATVAPAASIPAIAPANTGSIGDHGSATRQRRDDRRFGEPIGLVPQPARPSVGSGSHRDGESGTSRQEDCVVYQPRC